MNYTLGYLSEGKLFLSTPDGAEREVKSAFVDDLRGRLQSIKDRQEWKTQGSGAMFARGGLPMGVGSWEIDRMEARFSAACASPEEGSILYAIDAGDVHGIFSYNVAENYEQRLVHGPSRRFSALSACPEGEEVAVAITQMDGTGCLGLMKPARGGGVREITEGDAIDAFPAWTRGTRRALVYQSSGIARRNGQWAGLGPAGLQRLDMESGELDALAEDGKSDYLCPSVGADGALYFIHRPWEPPTAMKPVNVVKDVLLFPFRLVRALFGFLNAFSMIFSGKPLKTAGMPQRKGPDPKAVFLYGRWIHMEQQMAKAAQDQDPVSAVPRSWTLRRAAEGMPPDRAETIASGVMAYTVADDGTVFYSNGRGIFRLPPGGRAEKISKRELVTCLFVPKPAAPDTAS